jgi:hypothetical protein
MHIRIVSAQLQARLLHSDAAPSASEFAPVWVTLTESAQDQAPEISGCGLGATQRQAELPEELKRRSKPRGLSGDEFRNEFAAV